MISAHSIYQCIRGEDVDKIRLKVMEQGVEFEYSFHGKEVYPPRKYLSESHLNSLGIAAFLASVKLFNKTTGFFILDDIVSSFDANHRVRLAHLLREKFSKWQVVVLTHEPFWFDLLKEEMGTEGWMALELETVSNGQVQLKTSARNLKERSAQKEQEGTLSANDLRTLLERILKDLALALAVKMAFRRNDQNERRMPGELLSELRATLKKKSPATLSDPVFRRLDASGLVTRVGSHDSGPVLSSGDIKACFEDIIAFDKLFCCSHCRRYVSVDTYVGRDHKVFCKCGKKHLEWKN
jgi:hypothetical protein